MLKAILTAHLDKFTTWNHHQQTYIPHYWTWNHPVTTS